MKRIVKLLGCTNCRACEQACPVNAIEMVDNYQGFKVPRIHEDKCIDCGKCEQVCHILDDKYKDNITDNMDCYACINKNNQERMVSSSGGMFYVLAKSFLEKEASVIYACAYDDDFMPKHIKISEKEEIEKCLGSKYVQSDLGNSYKGILCDLQQKKHVMFVGTPCQVSGLKSFLSVMRCDQSRLFTIDLICHGTPSPKSWNDYLRIADEKVIPKKDINNIYFRNKKDGWHARIKVRFEDKKSNLFEDNIFTELFLSNLVLNDSCHSCRYASTSRVSDMTLGDYWGIENTIHQEMDDDAGVSAVIVHTKKGKDMFESVSSELDYEESNLDLIRNNQFTLNSPFPSPENKNEFWEKYYSKNLSDIVGQYTGCSYEEKKKYIVIAPDGSGSKGDEAMLRGVLDLLNYDDVLLVSPSERYPCSDAILDVKTRLSEKCVKESMIKDAITYPAKLIVIGADVLDGTCGLVSSIARIDAMQKMIELGGEVYAFSSFRSDVNESIIAALKELANNTTAHFYLRDEVSEKNFKEHISDRCEFFTDFAFLCPSIVTDITEKIRDQLMELSNEKIIGINFSQQSFNSLYKDNTIENIYDYINTTIETIDKIYQDVYFVLISHDVREWEGHLSDASFQKIAAKCLDMKNMNYMLVDPFISYPELRSILAHLDVVVSARMHLSVASIDANTIPIVYTGNGSKGTFSMIEKVQGMFEQRIGRTDLVASDKEQLERALETVRDDKENIESEIAYRNKENMREQSREFNNMREVLGVDKESYSEDDMNNQFIAYQVLRESRSICEGICIEKDDEIHAKENIIKNREQELQNRDQIIRDRQYEIDEQMREIRRLNQIREEYEYVKSTTTWKVVYRLYKIVKNPYKFRLRKIGEFFSYAKEHGYKEAFIRTKRLLLRQLDENEVLLFENAEIERMSLEILSIPESQQGEYRYEELIFEKTNNPLVSIVIPVYNQFEYTYLCLKAILERTKEIPYEIIIADDNSTDLTKDIKQLVKNITVVRNPDNLRFLLNCNKAAKSARGKYILFLNNDTQVQNNWLGALLELIESNSKIGMVGSKLVYPDGSLQEAGGILWSDGSAWNYGNADGPLLPEYNYVKEVDYISGAAIMIRRVLWEVIGGFDERFVPAYCEDSDLAFEVRKHGYKVLYQPKSVVVHFEGKSNGTDTSQGQKAYQVINKEKFQDKWKDVLNTEHEKHGKNVFTARDKSRNKKTILVIDHYVPKFDQDAGSRTTFQYLQMFVVQGYNVKFLGDNFYNEEPYTSALEQMGVEVLYGYWYSQNWKQWILENQKNIDAIYFNRPHITIKYIDFIKENTNIKCIYYGHDLHFLRLRREFEMTGDKIKQQESDDWLKKELYIMRKADMNYYPSQVEVDAIHEMDESIKVKAITAYIYSPDLEYKYEANERDGILFVGGFGHPPNADAVKWFLDDIYPSVLDHKKIKFYIVGSKVPDEIKKRESENVIVKGFVSDEELEELYRKCRMVVVPLRYGAGVKGKVVEALNYGTPIVTTTVGAEGIPEIDSTAIISDNAQILATEIVNVYDNQEELASMSKNSRELIKKYYGMDAVWNVIAEDFE